MTDKRISPLQWLSTKFASLNHSHNEYLTQHQDITGKEDKSNKSSSITTDTGSTSKYTTVKAIEDYAQPKGNYLTQHQSLKTVNNESLVGTGNITIDSGSDIDIVTSWEQTLSDEKVASEKLIKESIDSVLYETEELELGTPTTSSNVNFTIISEEDTETITIPTLNNCNFNNPSLYGFVEYEFDLNFPSNEDAIFVFGEESGFTLFRTSGASSGFMTFGDCDWRKNIYYDDHCYFRSYSSIKINVQLGINSSKIYLNDYDNTYREIYTSNDVMFSSNVTINSITAKLWNVPKQLSRYVDDINKVKELPPNADLNYINEDIIYVGYNDNNAMSHCPVSDKQFILINKDISYGSYHRSYFQQILMVLNLAYGSYEEVWVRYQEPSTGGFDGSWTKLATTSDLNSKQDTLVSGTSIKTINNESLLGSGNISISGGGTNGEYFFSKDSFFDSNQWGGFPTISNGVITLSSDVYFPLRLPPNCVLSFDLTTTNGYYEGITLLNSFSWAVNSDWLSGGVADITFTIVNNYATISSEATGDEFTLSNASSHYGLTIPIPNGTTATISNIVFTDTNRGGGSGTVDSSWVNNSTNPVQSQLIQTALDSKSDTSHTHTQYLTEHQSLANYVQKSSTTGLIKNDGTIMSGGTGSTNYAIGNHTHSNYITSSSLPTNTSDLNNDGDGTYSFITTYDIENMVSTNNIANNLTTTASGKVLDARQGKALADLIGQAITYINQ